MQSEGFIVDRWMIPIIKDICIKQDITVQSFSDDWILKLQRGDIESFIYGYHFGLNGATSDDIVQDKVATYQVLTAAGIEAVPHVIASTRAGTYSEWKREASGWQRFVIKPMYGGGGRGLKLFDTVDEADTYIATQVEQAWCVSPFLKLVKEIRVIMLDGKVLLAYEKNSPIIKSGIPMFNLRLGAIAKNVALEDEAIALAHTAQKAIGLHLVAIDIVVTDDGRRLVLELNSGFSLEHYMRQSEENQIQAIRFYSEVIRSLFPVNNK